MGLKRKAQEAFSKKNHGVKAQEVAPTVRLSAFAAAKARSQPTTTTNGLEDQNVADVGLQLRRSRAEVKEDAPSIDQGVTLAVSGRDLSHSTTSAVRSRSTSQAPVETGPNSTQRSTHTRLASINLRPPHLKHDGVVEVCLEQNAFVTPLGEYDLEILVGSASIYGATLHAKSGPQRVYALTTHALPQIVAKSPETVIRLSSVASLARNLERFSQLFRNIVATHDHKSSFVLLEHSSDDATQRSLSLLDSTKQYQATLTQLAMKSESKHGHMAVACIGGKSTGKSTFARHICNKLLTRTSQERCLLLDLDPGQPEFGPPGQISLVEVSAPIFGPAFTHVASKHSCRYKLLTAHTIAASSFKDDPHHYMNCVKALFEDKRVASARKNGSCPLVVNTCGWATGLGARILCDILQLDITDAVLIDAVDPTVLAAVKTSCEDLYAIDRPTLRTSTRSPAELRQMQTMAYFHTRTARTSTTEQRLTEKSIAHWRHWIISYDDRPGSISAIVSYGSSPSPDFLAEVIEGSLVALVTKEGNILSDVPEIQTHGDRNPLQRTPEGLPYLHVDRPFDPRTSDYHGLALVRGVDSASRQIHLITPLDQADIAVIMQRTVVLVRGAFDSPDWAYLEAVYDDGAADHNIERPWLARREMVGVEGAVWRLRHPPTAARAVYR